MTRPDYVILVFGIFLVISLNKMNNQRELFKLHILLLVGVLACYYSYQLIYMNFWSIILSYNDWTLVKIELAKKLFKKSSNSK